MLGKTSPASFKSSSRPPADPHGKAGQARVCRPCVSARARRRRPRPSTRRWTAVSWLGATQWVGVLVVIGVVSVRRTWASPLCPLRSLSSRFGPPSGARGPCFGRPTGHRFPRFTLPGGRHGAGRTMVMVCGAVWPTASAGCAPDPTGPDPIRGTRPSGKLDVQPTSPQTTPVDPERGVLQLARPGGPGRSSAGWGLGASARIRRTHMATPHRGVLAPADRSSRSSGERSVTPSSRGSPSTELVGSLRIRDACRWPCR